MARDRDALRHRLLIAVIAFFAGVNALLWSRTLPIGRDEVPDEAAHIEVARFEARYQRIPIFGVDDFGVKVVDTPQWRYPYHAYSAQPGLSYFAAAAAIAAAHASGPGEVRVARSLSVLLAALLALSIYAAARLICPADRDVAFLAATTAAAWPQLTFVFSYFNNDALTIVLGTCLIGAWYWCVRSAWPLWRETLLWIVTGLMLLSKPNGFPLALTSWIVVLAASEDSWKRRATRVLRGLLLVTIVAGWWYWIAWSRYGRDVFATGRALTLAARLNVGWPSGRVLGMPMLTFPFQRAPGAQKSWLALVFESAVGRFGLMSVPLPDVVYEAVAILLLVALAGALWQGRGLFSGEPRVVRRLHIVTLSILPVLLIVSAARSWSFDYQPQGRFLFPAAAAFFPLVAVGLLSAGGRFRALVALASSLAVMEVNLAALVGTLVPRYWTSRATWWAANSRLAACWTGITAGLIAMLLTHWLHQWREPRETSVRKPGSA
jgi:4-amino-4-deoxy-L-arabinose transferase-like glycosyltransferase